MHHGLGMAWGPVYCLLRRRGGCGPSRPASWPEPPVARRRRRADAGPRPQRAQSGPTPRAPTSGASSPTWSGARPPPWPARRSTALTGTAPDRAGPPAGPRPADGPLPRERGRSARCNEPRRPAPVSVAGRPLRSVSGRTGHQDTALLVAAALFAAGPALAQTQQQRALGTQSQTGSPPPTDPATPAAGLGSAVNRGDALTAPGFVRTAATSDLDQMEASRLAGQRSQNAEVKRFAERMLRDHGKTTGELKGMLGQLQGVSAQQMPTGPGRAAPGAAAAPARSARRGVRPPLRRAAAPVAPDGGGAVPRLRAIRRRRAAEAMGVADPAPPWRSISGRRSSCCNLPPGADPPPARRQAGAQSPRTEANLACASVGAEPAAEPLLAATSEEARPP